MLFPKFQNYCDTIIRTSGGFGVAESSGRICAVPMQILPIHDSALSESNAAKTLKQSGFALIIATSPNRLAHSFIPLPPEL